MSTDPFILKVLMKHWKMNEKNVEKTIDSIAQRKLVLKLSKGGAFEILEPTPLKGILIYDKNYKRFKKGEDLLNKKEWVYTQKVGDIERCILEFYSIYKY